MVQSLLKRLLATLWRDKSERRLNEEFGEHLEALTARQSEKGVRLDEARQAARREFGPIEPAKELYRDQLRFRSIENLGRDLRFALRQCGKNPGFTAAAVLSLALGIGANAALFSFVNAVLLRQLPVPEATRLAVLKHAGEPLILSYDQVTNLNREATGIDGLLGTHPIDVSVSLGDHPRWVSAELVTGEYFHTLRVKPERGRLLTQQDLDRAAGNPTCVISYRLWKSEFGSAPDVAGRTVLLNTRPYQIIGVSERGFNGADLQRPVDLQIPATRLADYMPAFVGIPNFDWKSRLSLFSAMARLKPQSTMADAAGQLTRLDRAHSKSGMLDKHSMDVELSDGNAGFQSSQLARPASILLAVSLVVLLIACANLATLLLSRTSARSSEFALRLAIGGSRARILAQVLVESSLLAVFGTAAGIAVAYAIQRILLSFLNRTTPEIHQLHVTLDGNVLAFVAATSGICVLLFGAAPAWQAARTAALGSSSAGNTRTGASTRKAFVAAQIALSFVVVLSAGLLAGTLRNLTAVDLGFRPDEIAAIEIRPAAGGYTGARADQFYARVLGRVRTLPGVKAAATGFGINFLDRYKMKLDPLRQDRAPMEASVLGVNPGYFDTFGAHILAGRDFTASDTPDKKQLYIISEHLARTYFQGENPVGRSMRHDGRDLPVIGVVSNIHDQGPRASSEDTIYQDAGQLLASSLTVFVRCDGACAPLLPGLRTGVQEVDPNTPILALRTLKTELEGAFSSQEVLGFLSMLFAALAMLLVGAGIYGVLSYTLMRRTREMGIRVALGASSNDIVRLFISEAAAMIGLGMLIGVPSALAAVTLLQSQLFGVQPHDSNTLAGCIVCIVGTVALASIAPIRRALCIAPQQALRID